MGKGLLVRMMTGKESFRPTERVSERYRLDGRAAGPVSPDAQMLVPSRDFADERFVDVDVMLKLH